MTETNKMGEGNIPELNFKRQKGVCWVVMGKRKKSIPGGWGRMSRDGDTENKWLLGDQQIILRLECRRGIKQ